MNYIIKLLKKHNLKFNLNTVSNKLYVNGLIIRDINSKSYLEILSILKSNKLIGG